MIGEVNTENRLSSHVKKARDPSLISLPDILFYLFQTSLIGNTMDFVTCVYHYVSLLSGFQMSFTENVSFITQTA